MSHAFGHGREEPDVLPCLPILPVEAAILDGLGHMGAADDLLARQIGDGAGYLEQTVVSSGRQPHKVESVFKKRFRFVREGTKRFEQVGGNLRIAEQGRARKPLLLYGTGLVDPFPYSGRAFAGRL